MRVELESGVRHRAFEREFFSCLLFIFFLPPSQIRRVRERIRPAIGSVRLSVNWCVVCASSSWAGITGRVSSPLTLWRSSVRVWSPSSRGKAELQHPGALARSTRRGCPSPPARCGSAARTGSPRSPAAPGPCSCCPPPLLSLVSFLACVGWMLWRVRECEDAGVFFIGEAS